MALLDSKLELVVVEGEGTGEHFALRDTRVVLGRREAKDKPSTDRVGFRDSTVSHHHAQLEWNAHKATYTLVHISRTNATLVNGDKVTSQRLLQLGDKIRMGNLVVQVRKLAAPKAPPSKPPPPKVPSTPYEEMVEQIRSLRPGFPKKKVSLEQVTLFTRQLSAMLDAGIPLASALNFFAESYDRNALTAVLEQVSQDISSGSRLSQAMRKHPQAFSEIYSSLVETGEESGTLNVVLSRLTELLGKQLDLQQRLAAALTYPCVLLTVSALAIFGFVCFILPMLEPVFLGMKVALPLPTRMLLMTRILFLPGAFLSALLASGAWLGQPWIRLYFKRNPEMRIRLARIPLRIPGLGSIVQKICCSRVLYSMATMLEAGMGLVPAVRRSAAVAGNAYLTDRLLKANVEIRDGTPVGEAFELTEAMPRMATSVISVGEEASGLSTMIKFAAKIYEEETELAITDLTNLIEPVMMCGLGLIVGFIVMASILPTISLIQSF